MYVYVRNLSVTLYIDNSYAYIKVAKVGKLRQIWKVSCWADSSSTQGAKYILSFQQKSLFFYILKGLSHELGRYVLVRPTYEVTEKWLNQYLRRYNVHVCFVHPLTSTRCFDPVRIDLGGLLPQLSGLNVTMGSHACVHTDPCWCDIHMGG